MKLFVKRSMLNFGCVILVTCCLTLSVRSLVVGCVKMRECKHDRVLCFKRHFIKATEGFFRVYIASSKHLRGWENSRRLCKSSQFKILLTAVFFFDQSCLHSCFSLCFQCKCAPVFDFQGTPVKLLYLR